jgi:hypothetical protein
MSSDLGRLNECDGLEPIMHLASVSLPDRQFKKVMRAGAAKGRNGLLEKYIEETENLHGIGPDSDVRASESADARAYLKSLEEN